MRIGTLLLQVAAELVQQFYIVETQVLLTVCLWLDVDGHINLLRVHSVS